MIINCILSNDICSFVFKDGIYDFTCFIDELKEIPFLYNLLILMEIEKKTYPDKIINTEFKNIDYAFLRLIIQKDNIWNEIVETLLNNGYSPYDIVINFEYLEIKRSASTSIYPPICPFSQYIYIYGYDDGLFLVGSTISHVKKTIEYEYIPINIICQFIRNKGMVLFDATNYVTIEEHKNVKEYEFQLGDDTSYNLPKEVIIFYENILFVPSTYIYFFVKCYEDALPEYMKAVLQL